MKRVCSGCGISKGLKLFRKTQGRYRPRCIKCEREYDLKRRSLGTRDDTLRNYFYISRFGVTLDQYDFMFEHQLGHCGICLEHQCNLPRRLSVDHDHVTGKVRGLLCRDCNLSLGFMGDSQELLKVAANYLEQGGTNAV